MAKSRLCFESRMEIVECKLAIPVCQFGLGSKTRVDERAAAKFKYLSLQHEEFEVFE